jgi:hypothetical protein
MKASGLLPVVLGALLPVLACGTAAAQPDDTVKALREKVIQADNVKRDPDRGVRPANTKAEAYNALFLKVGKAGLADLMKDEDTGIALQAAWEVYKKPAKRPKHLDRRSDDIYDRAELEKFRAFLKDRTKAPVPDWWAEAIVDVDLSPGENCQFHASGHSKPIGPNYHESRAGKYVYVPAGAELERRDGTLVYATGGRAVEFPEGTFGDGYIAGYAGLLGEKRSVIAAIDSSGFAFPLAGFEGKGGKPTWRADVWAAGRTIILGDPSGMVELRGKGDTAFVFGAEGFGMYLEAFDIATGKCRYRFCTCYWFHFPEQWGLK